MRALLVVAFACLLALGTAQTENFDEDEVSFVATGEESQIKEEFEEAIQAAMDDEAPADLVLLEESEAEVVQAEDSLDEAAELELNLEAQDEEADQETVVEGVTAEEDETPVSTPSAQEEQETLAMAAEADSEEEQQLNEAEAEEQNESENSGAEDSEEREEQLDAEAESAFFESQADVVPGKAVRAKVSKREFRQIKEATVHYVRALQKYLEKAYGGNAATMRQNGIKVLHKVYSLCQKYTGNRYLCGHIRDKYLKRFVNKDVLADDVAKKLGSMVFRTILTFAVHIKKNPEEFSGRFINEKKLKDPFKARPAFQGVHARRFLRAVTYEVKEKFPDLPHQIVSEWKEVVMSFNRKCNFVQRKVFFAHDVCKHLVVILNKSFSTQDVFTTKKIRREFLRAFLRVAARVWKKENPDAKPATVKEIMAGAAAAKKEEAKGKLTGKALTGADLKKAADFKKAQDAKLKAGDKKPAPKPLPRPVPKTPPKAAPKTAPPKPAPKPIDVLNHKYPKNVITQRYRARIPHDRMVITIRLNLPFANVAHKEDLPQFIKTFVNDVARALDILPRRVAVLSVSRGADEKVVVKFALLAHPENSAIHSNPLSVDSVDAQASKFIHMSQDTSTILYSSAILSKIDAYAEIVVAKELGSGDPTALLELASTESSTVHRGSGSYVQPAILSLVAGVLFAAAF